MSWIALCALACACATAKTEEKPPAPMVEEAKAPKPPPVLQVPLAYHHLDNGLKVVLSPDHTAPLVTIALYYNIGFRLEPKGRTGFAHLFEHLMFQASKNLAKQEFSKLVQGSGGILNGSTRLDYTNFYEIVPSNALERVLWAEADRMKGLAITAEHLKNQQDVVKSEVRVNVLNRPYGGFPWLWMPQVANTRWENAHNFYGDLADIDAATLADAKAFFESYYRPGNAAIAIVGDFEPEQALGWVKKYLGAVPAGAVPKKPDVSEPRQEAERRSVRVDALAQRPALAFAYHTPPPETPDYFALLLAHQLLAAGRDSALSLSLVQKKGFTDEVVGEVHALGTPFNVEGPETWTVSLRHDAKTSADTILAAAEEEIARLRDAKISPEQLERAKTKARSEFYDLIESSNGFGKADLLAAYALFYDQPERINSIVARYAAVTPEQVQKVAQEYLRPRLRKEAPPETELRAVQSYMTGIFVLRNSSRAGISSQLSFLDLHGLPASWLSTYLREVNAVTPATVRELADRWLKDDQCAIAVAGDAKVIKEQLAPYGEVIQ